MARLAQDFAVRYSAGWTGRAIPAWAHSTATTRRPARYTEARLTAMRRRSARRGWNEGRGRSSGRITTGRLSEPIRIARRRAGTAGANGFERDRGGIGERTSSAQYRRACLAPCLHLIKDALTPVTLETLWATCPGPDFPTGGVIVEPKEAIARPYSHRFAWRASAMRCRWEQEDLGRDLAGSSSPRSLPGAEVEA